jgi:hypothetical protein
MNDYVWAFLAGCAFTWFTAIFAVLFYKAEVNK